MSNKIVCGTFSGQRPAPPELYGRLDMAENMKEDLTGPKFEYEGFKLTSETHVASFEVFTNGSSAPSRFRLPINLLHRIFMIEEKSEICFKYEDLTYKVSHGFSIPFGDLLRGYFKGCKEGISDSHWKGTFKGEPITYPNFGTPYDKIEMKRSTVYFSFSHNTRRIYLGEGDKPIILRDFEDPECAELGIKTSDDFVADCSALFDGFAAEVAGDKRILFNKETEDGLEVGISMYGIWSQLHCYIEILVDKRLDGIDGSNLFITIDPNRNEKGVRLLLPLERGSNTNKPDQAPKIPDGTTKIVDGATYCYHAYCDKWVLDGVVCSEALHMKAMYPEALFYVRVLSGAQIEGRMTAAVIDGGVKAAFPDAGITNKDDETIGYRAKRLNNAYEILKITIPYKKEGISVADSSALEPLKGDVQAMAQACVKIDVGHGNTLGIREESDWDTTIPYAWTPEGWKGPFPTNRSFKFVIDSGSSVRWETIVGNRFLDAKPGQIIEDQILTEKEIKF